MEHFHFLLYKPYGYISQFVFNGKRKKKVLGDIFNFPKGTMAIGRLDEDSEGLLLLTTDGKVSYQVLSSKFEKEYIVQVDGLITTTAIKELKKGVEISINGAKYTTKPCEAKILNQPPEFPPRAKPIRDARHGPTSWISITLREGKFRQVRKMTAVVGFPTLRLVRRRIGEIYLPENIKAGDVIPLKTIL